MRVFGIIVGALVVASGLWGCSEPTADEELVVYTSRNDHLIKPVFDAYTEATGVRIRYITDNASALTARLQAEGERSPADMLITVDAGNLWNAAEKGLLSPVENALQQVRPSLVEAARTLGASASDVGRRIYLPMMLPGLFTALLLVGIDVMKEMPATLLLRPFGWDTLAVRIYELTAEGEWQRAAAPSLTLVLLGLVPVIVLSRRR